MKKSPMKESVSQERSFFVAMPAVLWQVLFFYLPMLFIVVISVVKRLDFSLLGNVTIEHYSTLFQPAYFKIIGRSLLYAFINSWLCFFLAYPVAYFLAFRARHLKGLLLFLLILPFLANFLVQVYAWLFVLEPEGFLNTFLMLTGIISHPLHILNTPFSIFVVMVFCYLPFMILPIYSSLEGINKPLFEASADLGARPWQTVLNIILPLSSGGIKNGFYLVFIPTFGEFVIPSLLGGGRQMFAGSLIQHLFLETRDMALGAAFTCVSGLVLIVSIGLLNVMLRALFGKDKV
jgi:spermidine/putrescine transport system permease protein